MHVRKSLKGVDGWTAGRALALAEAWTTVNEVPDAQGGRCRKDHRYDGMDTASSCIDRVLTVGRRLHGARMLRKHTHSLGALGCLDGPTCRHSAPRHHLEDLHWHHRACTRAMEPAISA